VVFCSVPERCDFLSLKNEVNVSSKKNKHKNLGSVPRVQIRIPTKMSRISPLFLVLQTPSQNIRHCSLPRVM
jgi:hypothetical protein